MEDYLRTVHQIYNIRYVLKRFDRQAVVGEYLDIICPQYKEIRTIHVGGTSGKTSTSYYIASLLSKKHRTGLLISPHVFDFNERIRTDMEPIPHTDLTALWHEILPVFEDMYRKDERYTPSFAESILILAFTYFVKKKVEWAVVEARLGGLYDQTNFLTPEASVITNISLDHTHILGRTVEQIAREKGGIIKENVSFFTSETNEIILKIFREICESKNAPFHRSVPELTEDGFINNGRIFTTRMAGKHQVCNANLAVDVVEHLLDSEKESSEQDIQNALTSVSVPCRFQRLDDKTIADIAHNPVKMKSLAENLGSMKGHKIAVIGISDTKDHKAMLRHILPAVDRVILTRAKRRGADPKNLLRICEELGCTENVSVIEDSKEAYATAREMCPSDGIIVVTGSTFLIDEILNPSRELAEINIKFNELEKRMER